MLINVYCIIIVLIIFIIFITDNWYQNTPIQFQFDGEDDIQQQPINLINSDQHQQMQQAQQFFVTAVPDGCIPLHLNGGGIGGNQLPQGVPEFAFANIPTNIALNFNGDNFAMHSQPSFGPRPTNTTSFPMNMNMNPMNPNHFVGFNDQFPSTNNNEIVDVNDINDIPQDIMDINDTNQNQNSQDIDQCARINNNENVDDTVNNHDQQEQDQIDMNMIDTNDNDNDNHHFVAQDQIEDIENDGGDLLPPAINEQPMRPQYSHCSEASNTTNTTHSTHGTHLSHDSHGPINVNNYHYNIQVWL